MGFVEVGVLGRELLRRSDEDGRESGDAGVDEAFDAGFRFVEGFKLMETIVDVRGNGISGEEFCRAHHFFCLSVCSVWDCESE